MKTGRYPAIAEESLKNRHAGRKSEAENKKREARRKKEKRGKGEKMTRILVAEDDLALSAGLCFELDTAGYLTVAAYSCAKARQLLEEDSFRLAILDVNLPDGSGFDLCREIGEKQP